MNRKIECDELLKEDVRHSVRILCAEAAYFRSYQSKNPRQRAKFTGTNKNNSSKNNPSTSTATRKDNEHPTCWLPALKQTVRNETKIKRRSFARSINHTQRYKIVISEKLIGHFEAPVPKRVNLLRITPGLSATS